MSLKCKLTLTNKINFNEDVGDDNSDDNNQADPLICKKCTIIIKVTIKT